LDEELGSAFRFSRPPRRDLSSFKANPPRVYLPPNVPPLFFSRAKHFRPMNFAGENNLEAMQRSPLSVGIKIHETGRQPNDSRRR